MGITAALAWLFLGHGFAARADEPVAVDIKATAEVREAVPTSDGHTQWRYKPAGLLHPGEEVCFTLAVRNPTPVVAPDVVVTWPVPANTVYVARSASGPGAEVTFSVDGGESFNTANGLRIVDPSGTERRATERDYTHLRWHLRYPLAPDAVALLRFRAVFQ